MGNNLWSTKFLAFAKLDATRRKECEKVYERKHRERGRELGAASPRLDRHDAEHGGSRGNVYEDTARLEDDAVVQGEPAARG
eukprot:5084232-Prymnesium_polylepis.1